MINVQASLGSWTASAGPDTFTDAAGLQWDLTGIDGWWGGLATNSFSVPRLRGDGSHDGPTYMQDRQVVLTGNVTAPNADMLQQGMDVVAGLLMGGDRSATLSVAETSRGQTLTSFVRAASQPRAKRVSELVATWEIDLVCPDPKRYGAVPISVSTGLPKPAAGGLSYPVAYPLSYGAGGSPGTLTVTNPGTADAPIVFTVSGNLPQGFVISYNFQYLYYYATLFPGQPVVIDTGAGTVLVEGTADRRSSLAYADWIQAPAGSSATISFISNDGSYDPAATLTATYAPAFW